MAGWCAVHANDALLAASPSVPDGLRPWFLDELPLARAASAWAAVLHAGQVRPNGRPYVLHVVDRYRASLEVLERRAPTLRLVRQLRFELWALNVLPSRDSWRRAR